MIVKMQKLHLAAMRADKDRLLDALQKTRAAEIKQIPDVEGTHVPQKDVKAIEEKIALLSAALDALTREAENYAKEKGIKCSYLKDGFDVSYSTFTGMAERGEEAAALLKRVNALLEEKSALLAERAALEREEKNAALYAEIDLPYAAFAATRKTNVVLGVVPTAKEDAFQERLQGKSESGTDGEGACAVLAAEKLAANENGGVYVVAYLKENSQKAEEVLSFASFSCCPYGAKEEKKAISGKEKYKQVKEACEKNAEAVRKNAEAFYEAAKDVPFLKTYVDYVCYLAEKENTSDSMRATERTFFLEAYVPEECVNEVSAALDGVSGAIYYEFDEPSDEDNPPTLLKNNAIVRNFEDVTNMYSVPNSREFDPNGVMGFFYALFMGFIIGDMGYGLIMMLGGGLIWYKNRGKESGFKRLSAAFALGGVFAVLWGILFNSLLGLPVLPFTVMPDMQQDMWSVAGVNVPSVLVIAMEIGVVQICVGYICKAVQLWRRKDVFGGICEGVFWAIFSVGVGLAIVGFVEQSNLPVLKKVGGITAGGALALAVLTAGRKEKFFGKFTKGFGAAYGVINYASDILSYARLYGLLLSGAVVANIISSSAVGFIASGNVLVAVLGVLLMVAGHAFNLAMNLLGAYIHDARLQYVEFFGRFYEGEGELFTPLGSSQKYVCLLPAEKTAA